MRLRIHWLAKLEGSTSETEHTLHVVSLGKEIHQVRLLHAISESQQAAEVSSKCGRIARHISNARHCQLPNTTHYAFT
jgi:hypothetical protein